MYNSIFLFLHNLNIDLFGMINAGNDLQGIALVVAKIIAVKVIYLVPVVLLSLWLLGKHQYRFAAVQAFVATTIGLTLNHLIGTIWPHARPFAQNIGHTYLEHAASSSFPSNHGTIMFTVALSLAFQHQQLRKIGLALLIPSLLMAWARIFVGVHWPLDMAGAFVMACFLTYVMNTRTVLNTIYHLTNYAEAIYMKLLTRTLKRKWFMP